MATTQSTSARPKRWAHGLAVFISVVSSVVLAQAPPEYALALPSAPLLTALRQLSEAIELQMVVSDRSGASEQMLARPLQGRFTADAALCALLAGTHLRHHHTDEDTVTITDRPTDASPARFMYPCECKQPPHAGVEGIEISVTGSRLGGDTGTTRIRVYEPREGAHDPAASK